MITGYNIHEGAEELTRRRRAKAVSDLDREVAAAMLRRLTVVQLWQLALRLLAEQRQPPGVRA